MKLRVGIMAKNHIDCHLTGTYLCQQTNTTHTDCDLTCTYTDGDIVWQDQHFTTLVFIPVQHEACRFTLRQVTIGIDFHWQRREDQTFKGELHFIVEGDNLRAINTLPIEDYLESVISSEMSATSSIELLKAHAVISRSWVLHPLLNPQFSVSEGMQLTSEGQDEIVKWYERDAHVNFDVCADDHCQRYQGVTRATTAAIRQALDETRGEALVHDGQICDARFSKSCGGVSEQFSNCWAEVDFPYLTPIADHANTSINTLPDLRIEHNAEQWIRTQPEAFCNTHDTTILSQVLNLYDQETNDFYRWQVHYTQAELSHLVKHRSGIDFGTISALIPIERGPSGRLTRLKIVGSERTLIVGKELEIRKWLSESHLYSSAFIVDIDEANNFTLTGAGWGHGVGLCQIGAAVMSAQGYNYREILYHYFRKAEIKQLY